MKPDSRNSVLDLLPGQVLRLHAAAGVTIGCDGGTLWVTQEGCARDDFLRAGESLGITLGGVTLAEALGGTAARLTLRAHHASSRVIGAFKARVAFQAPLNSSAHATVRRQISSDRGGALIAAGGREARSDYL